MFRGTDKEYWKSGNVIYDNEKRHASAQRRPGRTFTPVKFITTNSLHTALKDQALGYISDPSDRLYKTLQGLRSAMRQRDVIDYDTFYVIRDETRPVWVSKKRPEISPAQRQTIDDALTIIGDDTIKWTMYKTREGNLVITVRPVTD